MIDLYLHFASQEAMIEALGAIGMTYTHEDGSEHLRPGDHDYSVYEVGEILGIDAWHLNIRVINPEFDYSALEPYLVIPKNPRVVWA